MRQSLHEYAKAHSDVQQPEAERAAMQATADRIETRAAANAAAEGLKTSITEQLQGGNAPQAILYSAIRCIGLLSSDAEWADAASGLLDDIYADIAQQTMFTDEATIAAKRLAERQQQYNDKLKRQLERQLSACHRLENELNDALRVINTTEI